MLEVFFFSAMDFSDLLQAHDVCIQLLNGQTQIVDLQTPRWPQALHTLVDVVGGDLQEGRLFSWHGQVPSNVAASKWLRHLKARSTGLRHHAKHAIGARCVLLD